MDIRDTSNAAYEAFEYLVDMFGSDTVLNEMYDYLSIDDAVSFMHDFIKLYDVDTFGLDAETIDLINEHYRTECE